MANKGRPTKLTDAVAIGICQAIADGNFRSVAARAHGVSPRTMRQWMRSGRLHPDGIYGTFRKLVLETEAVTEAMFVAAVTRKSLDDAWLMLEFLSRKHPQRYGRYRGEVAEVKKRIKELEREIGGRPASDLDDKPVDGWLSGGG